MLTYKLIVICVNHSQLEVPPTPRQPTTTQASTQNSAAPINATDSRWISSLRRRDPEIQPTLPSINSHHLTNNNVAFTIQNEKRGRSSKTSNGIRKSRSVDRLRARKVNFLNMNKELLYQFCTLFINS